MTARQAIRREGDEAEARFLRLLGRDAKKTDDNKKGDAIVLVDGKEHYVEIKQCAAGPGENGTINQVRAIKYTCCIIYASERGCWYVVPPNELVALVRTKARGQHTEIGFECANLSLNNLEPFRCEEVNLCARVQAAVRQGECAGWLRDLMNALLAELRSLWSRYGALTDPSNKR